MVGTTLLLATVLAVVVASAGALLCVQRWRRRGSAWAEWVGRVRQAARGEEARVGVVTAHPDDEAMFFVPVIDALHRAGVRCSLLCLSTGNHDGLGSVRQQELVASGRVLGIGPDRVVCVDDPALQDGPGRVWPPDHVAERVDRFVREQRAVALVTFDSGGVSGHPNHAAVSAGVSAWLSRQPPERWGGRVLELESTPLLRKYAGPVDLLWSLACGPGRLLAVWSWSSRGRSFAAMRAHASQWVWYRRLFVLFSRYSLVNTLCEVGVPSSPAGDGATSQPSFFMSEAPATKRE